MSVIEMPAPLRQEPAYGKKIGRVWLANSKEACWGEDTWVRSRAQFKALKDGLIFEVVAEAKRAARILRASLWHRAKQAKKNGMALPEYDYWEEATQDSDFVFWAEIESAFHKAFLKTGPGCYQMLKHYEMLASLMNVAINRKHGRQEHITPARLKELVSFIQEPTE